MRQTLSIRETMLAAPVAGVLGGLMGAFFSRAVLATGRTRWTPVARLRARPVVFAGSLGMVVAIVGVASGLTWGTGYDAARGIITGADMPHWFGIAKLLTTLATAVSGMPGGIFAPSLEVGAGVGDMLRWLFPTYPGGAIVLLGMVAYFTGVVRAPLTAVIIISETTASRGLMMPLLASALIADVVAQTVSKERLYHALSQGFLPARERNAAIDPYDKPEPPTDSGTGMTPEVIDRVFEPFFTTKPLGQGTGLGLSMVYGFARQSGGYVRIYSEVGQGTTVCIYLPRYHGDIADDEVETQRLAAEASGGQTILVVDDEATIRHLIDEVLDESGYTVIGAADGAAGLKVLQSGARIELLITDVGLPNGMNGRQVADQARVLRPGLKVLFITGFAENAAVGNGHLEAGMELLTKPFTLEALTGKVAAMLRLS
jgi:CheY-like chemotaxis protein